jgi:hypothetical protein
LAVGALTPRLSLKGRVTSGILVAPVDERTNRAILAAAYPISHATAAPGLLLPASSEKTVSRSTVISVAGLAKFNAHHHEPAALMP